MSSRMAKKSTKLQNKADLIISQKKNANLFVDLITDLEDENLKTVVKAINGVTKVCLHLLNSSVIVMGSKIDKEHAETNEARYSLWMKERYHDCCSTLCSLFDHVEDTVRDLALMSMMNLLKAEAKNVKNADRFPVQILFQIINSMIGTGSTGSSLSMINTIERFQERFCRFDDVRFYTIKALYNAVTKMNLKPSNTEMMFHLMKDLNMPPSKNDEPLKNFFISHDKNDDNSKSLCPKEQRKLFSSMWIDFLAIEISPSLYESVLMILHEKVMPFMTNPLPLSDFLILSYSLGGKISLLALNGLFILMTSYNLDYPDFYKKLYKLLTPCIFKTPYISQFLKLLDLFLSSTHLPANLVAAFIKRLAQISLVLHLTLNQAVLTLIINLLIRHPNCQVLIHRVTSDACLKDPYDENAQDPIESKALESSLWEIKSLQDHVCFLNSERSEKINGALPKIELPYVKHTTANYTTFLDKERRKKRFKDASYRHATKNPSMHPSFFGQIM